MSIELQLTLRILQKIQQHTPEDPIPGRALAEEFGINRRDVQRHIEELRDAGYKIGSSMGEDPGYFIAKHPHELLPTANHYRHRAKVFCQKANRLMDFGSDAPEIFEQPIEPEGAI